MKSTDYFHSKNVYFIYLKLSLGCYNTFVSADFKRCHLLHNGYTPDSTLLIKMLKTPIFLSNYVTSDRNMILSENKILVKDKTIPNLTMSVI